MTRYRIDPSRSQVWIEATSNVHPIHSRASGLEGWVDLRLTKSGALDLRSPAEAHVEFPVRGLRSSNPLEERELRRRIDARRHPLISGTVTAMERADGPGRVVVTGDVTFRGVTRSHTDEVQIALDEAGSLHLEGHTTFDVRDFGMEPPRILVLRVEPLVEVRIEVVADPEEGST